MINLLPSQQKEELFQERKYKFLLIFGVSAIFFLIIFSLLLFSIKTFIFEKIEEENLIISPELQDSERNIMKINEKLRNLNSFYANLPSFGEYLGKISRMLPRGIYLTSLIFNFSEKEEIFSVSLQGFSPTRDLLFQLKRNLESESSFKDINFPPSNWVKPEDINFHISFKSEI